MSVKRNATKIIILSILGVSVGAVGMYSYDKSHSMRRDLASSKVGSPKWQPLPLGKHLATISSEIEKPELVPDTAEQEITLTGYIYVRQQVSSDIEYNWIIPPEVKVVSGEVSDSFANAKSGSVIKVQISVTGFSKEIQSMITLKTTTTISGQPIGSSAVIVSKPEETWDGVAQEMKKSAEEQLQENAVKVK